MVQDNIASTQPPFAACGVTTLQGNSVRGAAAVATYRDTGRRGGMVLRGNAHCTLE